ncbi:MAG: malate dehydrogenase [Thermoleophilaceae bacterium]|nr:malate dehydrogenase [Thermoleophilaceae bacterium]
MKARRKITIVGAGKVGATTGLLLAQGGWAETVLVDIDGGRARGKALDIAQAAPALGFEPHIRGAGGYDEASGSDIVVITAGFAREPGMGRDALLARNREIVEQICLEVMVRCPDAIVIVVTNPLDAICHLVQQVTQFPRGRVIGMSGILDSSRLRTFIAWELGVSTRDIEGMVLGGYGDMMVPVISATRVAGVPVSELIPPERLASIIERVRSGGEEVVSLLDRGYPFYAAAAGIRQMVEAICLDRGRVLPCSALLLGEYGIDGLFMGVPARLGAQGIEEVVELPLTDSEREEFERSAATVRVLVDALAYSEAP